jgi:hypothetical protein
MRYGTDWEEIRRRERKEMKVREDKGEEERGEKLGTKEIIPR